MTRILFIVFVFQSVVGVFGPPPARADSLSLIGCEFRADRPFPEFMPLWREGWSLRDEHGDLIRYARPDMALGGYLHAFIRNTSASPLEIEDVSLNGISLAQAIAPEGPIANTGNRYASSIAFAKLPADSMETLQRMGEPVWWKVDPFTVPAGGFAEVVVRLRRVPGIERIALGASAKDGGRIESDLLVNRTAPRFVGIGFSPAGDRAYVYLRHPKAGQIPNSLFIDGTDATARTTFVSDPGQAIIPAVVALDPPVREGEYHVFEARYPDGQVARSSIRVDHPDFVYGMWGGFAMEQESQTLDADGARYIEDLRSHNINTIMEQYGRSVRAYVRRPTGQAECAKHGIRIMDHNPDMFPNQRYVFLHDEPDAKDVRLEALPLDKRIGTRGQWLVGVGRQFRAQSPSLLQVLNIDNTFRPENWYTYAQLPDVPAADPYYQAQLRSVYLTDPGYAHAYTKPTYVYAVGAIYQSACAPKPMHLILNACRSNAPEEPFRFRAPTPEEKRVELYYSLASGARGISFWWYTPGSRAHGVGSDAPEMRRLFAEIGLVGAEFRTAEPILTRACPSPIDLQASPMLWARALLAGTDTLVLVIVNDNIASDRLGTAVQPLANARVSLRPPAWLKMQDAFEITCSGVKTVPTRNQEPGLTIDLGRVDLTRLVVLTSDAQLRTQLQQRFEDQFADTARKLLAEAGPREVPQFDKSQDKAPPKASQGRK